MTGRDLILYILANNLENEPVFKNGKFVGFDTEESFAAKHNVGIETVRVQILMGGIDCFRSGNKIYIPITKKAYYRRHSYECLLIVWRFSNYRHNIKIGG